MLDVPNSGKEAEFPLIQSQECTPPQKAKVIRWRRRIWLTAGCTLLAGLVGGLAYGWFFIQRQLVPLTEKQLTDLLNRPVKVGSLQGLAWGGVRFGASEIPATPTDPDWVKAEAVDISFDPVKLLRERKLNLYVTLVEPDLYVEQAHNKDWLSTRIDPIRDKQPIKVELKTLGFRDADVVLVARSAAGTLKTPVQFQVPAGMTRLLNDKQLKGNYLEFELEGQLVKGGDLEVKGLMRFDTKAINLALSGKDLDAQEVGNLLLLPLNLQAGKIDANLDVRLQHKQKPLIEGVATLAGVTTRIPQLPQPFASTNGQLHFQGSQIRLDKVAAVFGAIPGVADGSVDMAGNYDLQVQTEPISVTQALKSLKLPAPNVPISGKMVASMRLSGSQNKPKLDIDLSTLGTSRIDQVDFRSFDANLELLGSTLTVKDWQGLPTVGGRLQGKGQIKLPHKSAVGAQGLRPSPQEGLRPSPQSAFTFDVTATNIPGSAIANLYGANLPVSVGPVSGKAQLVGSLDKLNNLRATGSASFPLAGGKVSATKMEYAQRNWRGTVQASNLQLGSLVADSNKLLPSTLLHQGRLAGTWEVSGNLDSSQQYAILAQGSAKLTLEKGSVIADNWQLTGVGWKGNFQAQDIELARLFPDVFCQGKDNCTQTWGTLNGQFNLAGNLDGSLAAIHGRGKARLGVAGGAVAARNLQVSDGKFKALVMPENVKLASFSALPGQLNGQLQVSGDLSNLNPTAMQAKGSLNFSQGLSLIDRPLTATGSWDGRQLKIARATAKGLQASGFVTINPSWLNNQQAKVNPVQQFQFDVQAKGLNLKGLPVSLPQSIQQIDYSGKVDFAGKIGGTFAKPQLEGEVALHNFQIPETSLQVAPLLTGKVQILPQEGVSLDLVGGQDVLKLELDAENKPLSLALHWGQLNLLASRQGEKLLLEAKEIPLGLFPQLASAAQFTLPAAVTSPPLAGELSGNLAYDLNTGNLSGTQMAIAQPRWGNLSGDRLTGNFSYAGGNLNVTDAQLQWGKSRYQLEGSLRQTQAGPQFQASVAVADGKIEQLLNDWQIFELADFQRGLTPPTYAKAADLYPEANSCPSPPCPLISVGVPEVPVLAQLQLLAESETLLQKQRSSRQEATLLPELAELRGNFAGKLLLSGSLNAGIQAQFDFQGQDWQWGKFSADSLTARGSFQNGTLTLLPLEIQAGEKSLAFAGSFGSTSQSAQLRLNRVPIDFIQDLVELPPGMSFAGVLDAQVAIAGSRDNPQARGNFAVAAANINQTSIQSTEGNFTYRDARLDFSASSTLTQGTQPLTLKATLPYQLPFATVKPDSDQLSLSLNIENEGLSLLNILSRGQIAWIDGQGEVKLDVTGIFDQKQGIPRQIRAEGVAKIANATIAAQVLPDAPLTDVKGKILFDFDHIYMESLTGNFSGGEVAVVGNLPLVQATPQDNPLTITLRDLAFNLKGLYQGGVQGELQIAGSALEPEIGGALKLFDGQILLSEAIGEKGKGGKIDSGLAAKTQFQNLNLELGKNIQITSQPILNFLASGSLTLNGTVSQPRPEGTIHLKNGQVNLFATQLSLAGGEDNTASFTPNRGLDPYLEVLLVGSVTETTRRTPTPSDPLSAEVADVQVTTGSLQTIRIQAKVQGLASQLAKSVELTSTPQRSETEIFALLGGSFVNTIAQGDAPIGLANLAGSAVLGNFQGAVGAAFGLSEFRIFPAQIVDAEQPKESSSDPKWGLGVEASVDLTRQLSLSVQKIVTNDQPTELGVRYRINKNVTVRGSTDFSDNSRARIEYERRF